MGASQSDCLASYPGHPLGGGESYPSAEIQSVYSTSPADWADNNKNEVNSLNIVSNNKGSFVIVTHGSRFECGPGLYNDFHVNYDLVRSQNNISFPLFLIV